MEKNHNMGSGKLGMPGITFVRKFRFLVSGEHLGDDFNYAFHVNYKKKTLKLSAYEVFTDEGIPIHNWAAAMEAGKYPDETLLLIALDGCGREMYRKRFSGLKIVDSEHDFNYDANDVTLYEVTLSYKDCEKEDTQDSTRQVQHKESSVSHLNTRVFIK